MYSMDVKRKQSKEPTETEVCGGVRRHSLSDYPVQGAFATATHTSPSFPPQPSPTIIICIIVIQSSAHYLPRWPSTSCAMENKVTLNTTLDKTLRDTVHVAFSRKAAYTLMVFYSNDLETLPGCKSLVKYVRSLV